MAKFKTILATTALAGTMAVAPQVQASYQPFLGQVVVYPYNFCPRGWAAAQGQILAIQSNTALFALLGTTYGGNGTTTFALPDLRGRGFFDQGQGPGLSFRVQGEQGGAETRTLNNQQMPIHTHTTRLRVSAQGGDSVQALRNGFAVSANAYQAGAPPTPAAYLNAAAPSLGTAGGNQPFASRAPYLTLTPCVAIEGIFPSRN